MPERAQLLQRFGFFKWCLRQFRKLLEKRHAVGVDADMVQRRSRVRLQCGCGVIGRSVAPAGNGRTAEIQRQLLCIAHDLDDVGVVPIVPRAQRMGCRGHGGRGCVGQLLGNGSRQGRVDQRFVALYIDDNGLIRQLQQGAGLRQPIAAAGMLGAGEDGFHAKICAGMHDARVVCRHHNTCGGMGTVGLLHALRHAHHHGNAGNVCQRFFWQARAVQARGNQYGVRHDVVSTGRLARAVSTSASLRLRASCSSMTGMPSRTG